MLYAHSINKTRSGISLPSTCLTMRWVDTSSSRFLLKWAWVISWDQFVGCWLYFWAWFVLTVVIFLVFHTLQLANKRRFSPWMKRVHLFQPGFLRLVDQVIGRVFWNYFLECTPSNVYYGLWDGKWSSNYQFLEAILWGLLACQIVPVIRHVAPGDEQQHNGRRSL